MQSFVRNHCVFLTLLTLELQLQDIFRGHLKCFCLWTNTNFLNDKSLNTLAFMPLLTTGGYIYFDIFSKNDEEAPKVTMTSKIIKASEDREPVCLSFWYAASSDDRDAKLSIYRETADASSNDAENPQPEALGLLVRSSKFGIASMLDCCGC